MKRLQNYGPAAILWTLWVLEMLPETCLVHTQCVRPADVAVTGDGYIRYTQSIQMKGCYTRGYRSHHKSAPGVTYWIWV